MTTTLIQHAERVVAWDDSADSHVYLRDADVVFEDNRFSFVGHDYSGPADNTVDGRGLMLMPGLVDIHCHPTSEPGNKGLLEELGSPRLGQSSLYEFMPVFRIPPEAAWPATQVAVAELLKSGVTTLTDLSGYREDWAEQLAATGIRGVLCPMYRSATWATRNGHSVEYTWDEAAGERAMQQALDCIDAASKHPSGRISGMVGPAQLDTCTEDLLKNSLAEARRRDIPLQIHAAQSVVEFNEIMQRHGKTPVEFLDSLGLLGPDTIIGHGIFLNDHPWLHRPHHRDFERLAASGAAVAHCPTVFCRRGIALNTLGRYRQAGITMGMGTDTFPHNFIDEMRNAAYMGRVLAGDYAAVSTRDVFMAATVGGARALKRADLGRVRVGEKADFSLVDLGHPSMQPGREPLRALIYSASDRPVRDVYVDGVQVVAGGEVTTIDLEPALAALNEAQRASIAGVTERDWAGRSIEQMTPMVFPEHLGPRRTEDR